MPLPIWLIPVALKGAAVVAGVAGVGSAAQGVMKMKDANDTMEAAKSRHERNNERFEKENKETSKSMDKLGKLEMEILHSFGDFADVFEQIKNRPTFENYKKNGVELPKYDGEKLKEVSVGAGVLLGGLGGAGLGTAGGFVAAGATTAAVMAFGTASTGPAIASLSGAAALGAATLGVGLLVGGAIFNFTGGKLSDKADEAWDQMLKAEAQINTICAYLVDLRGISKKYYDVVSKVDAIYRKHLSELKDIVYIQGHTDWRTFTAEQRKITENTVLLVGLLYSMCKIALVLKGENENDMNKINKTEINRAINNANTVLEDKFQDAK